MNDGQRAIPELQPWLISLSKRMTKPPASVRKGLLISAFLPGIGEAYEGDVAKGLRVFLYAIVFAVLSILTSHVFFPSGPLIVRIIHPVMMVAVVAVWLYGIIRTVQFYEAEINLWQAKVGLPPIREMFDVREYLNRIRALGGKRNAESNLEGMLNDPKRAIVTMSMIVSLTFIATKFNVFMDKVWIANISDAAVAAIATVSPIYSAVSAVGVGIGTGACVCISYVLGKGEYRKTQDLATASIFLSLALSVPLALFLILSVDPIVGTQGPEVTGLARQYMIPLAIGSPAVILSGVLGCLFKAEGAMGKMTFCALASIPVDMALSPLLIYVFGWGIVGASVANVLGSAVSVAVSLYLFRKGGYHFRIRLGIPSSGSMKEITSVGGPKAVEEVFGGLIILAQCMIIAMKTGSDTLALVELAFTFPYFLTFIPDSLTSGAQPVCSAHAGRKDVAGMWSSMKYVLAVNLLISLTMTAVMFVFALQICSLFNGGDQSKVSDELLTITRMFAFLIPLYLLGRMSGDLLQVVRRSEVSAIVFSSLGALRLMALYIWGNSAMEVAWLDLISTCITGLVMFLILWYYAKRFDPDEVDERSERRSNVFSILWNRKTAAEE